MSNRLCTYIVWGFILLYAGALLVFLIGTFGWFGQDRDPLSGVFLLPLGLPWNQFLDFLGESVRPWAAAAAPILNVVILEFLCARFSS